MTSDEITKFELKENGQKTPTFNEDLDLCKNEIFINIEINDQNINEIFNQIRKLIKEKKMLNQITFTIINGYSVRNKSISIHIK